MEPRRPRRGSSLQRGGGAAAPVRILSCPIVQIFRAIGIMRAGSEWRRAGMAKRYAQTHLRPVSAWGRPDSIPAWARSELRRGAVSRFPSGRTGGPAIRSDRAGDRSAKRAGWPRSRPAHASRARSHFALLPSASALRASVARLAGRPSSIARSSDLLPAVLFFSWRCASPR